MARTAQPTTPAAKTVINQTYQPRFDVRGNMDGHFVSPESGKGREIPLGEDVRVALAEHVQHDRGPLVFCDAARLLDRAPVTTPAPNPPGKFVARVASRGP